MKQLALFCFLAGFALLGAGCDKELKEHPVPPELQQQLDAQKDPKNKEFEIAGQISIDPSLSGPIPENAVLFVIARPSGVKEGPPLAVKRHSLVRFPFDYNIGPANTMMEGAVFEGPMDITVRLDQDGNAKAGAGDLLGMRSANAGENGVNIVLNQKVSADVADRPSSVSGVVRLDPNLKDRLPDHWVLFLLARRPDVSRGPPLAVKRLSGVTFPYEFTLGQDDTMMPGVVFDGEIALTVRIDQDGNAMPGAGDIQGNLTASVGDTDLEITLDEVVGG